MIRTAIKVRFIRISFREMISFPSAAIWTRFRTNTELKDVNTNTSGKLRLYRRIGTVSDVAKLSPYLFSLPERAIRSMTALASGLVREVGEVTIPLAIRRGRLYQNLVEATLRFLIEQVGQVEGVFPGEEKLSEDFLVRRTAGNGIELIGILAFRASPVWVLAALADASGAGRHLIREITGS